MTQKHCWQPLFANWRSKWLFGFTLGRDGIYLYLFSMTVALERISYLGTDED